MAGWTGPGTVSPPHGRLGSNTSAAKERREGAAEKERARGGKPSNSAWRRTYGARVKATQHASTPIIGCSAEGRRVVFEACLGCTRGAAANLQLRRVAPRPPAVTGRSGREVGKKPRRFGSCSHRETVCAVRGRCCGSLSLIIFSIF